MTKLTDFDGRSFFVVGLTPQAEKRRVRDVLAQAKAHGCLLREVPFLGSPGAKFAPSFDVTVEGGVVTKIVSKSRKGRNSRARSA